MSDVLDPVTRIHIEKAAEALQDEFAGTFSRETIARFLAESVDLLGDSKINVFVPVLAHRFARERLKALGQAEGLITKEQPEVLFVCVQNAGRSQMAAGLVNLRSGGAVHVRSAGSDPAEVVNPLAAEATGRARRRSRRRIPEAADGRGRASGGCRRDDGLRRCVPDLPGQALRGLGGRRSRARRHTRRGARDPGRHRRTRTTAAHRARGSRRFSDRWRTLRGGPCRGRPSDRQSVGWRS